MEIVGTIESIIFRNEANGYTVADIDSNDILITAVGRFPCIKEGEKVKLYGSYIENKKYGTQFNCDRIEILKNNTIEGIIRYLSSGLIKGVGPKIAERIVEKFGKDTLDVIEYNHEKLVEVSGISKDKAETIYEAYNSIRQMQQAVMFLQEYDITTNMAVKIYGIYKNKTIEIVKNNPYRLVEDVDGIGFLSADKIAQNIGIAKDSEFRLRAGLIYTLKENCERCGNTYLPKVELITAVIKLLELDIEPLENMLENVLTVMQMDGVIRQFVDAGVEIVMSSKFYNIERSVAQRIVRLINTSIEYDRNIDKEIEFYEKINKITLHDDQKSAVKMAVSKGMCVITGGPGTGKTTIIKCILSILGNMGMKSKLLAPTGRAAKRMSESTGQNASTIHRALDINFEGGEGGFCYNDDNKLPYEVIIVDEVSMVDVTLMNHLIKAIEVGTKLILVGDKDQLPSVGAGNVLSDLLSCGLVPVSYLTKIYRQDDSSLIITNAHLINEGKMPIIDNSSNDFYYESKESSMEVAETIISLVTKRIPAHFGIDSSRVQILAPLKAGVTGVENLNALIQEKLNPPSIYKKELTAFHTIYREGDKVMQISNNYNQEWKRLDNGVLEQGSGVFNGDIGTIMQINRNTGSIDVLFEDGRETTYLSTDLNQLVLSYAITIHKSQGSEFDVVIMPLMGGSPHILTRNLLYTGVTRAKKIVILLGERKFLNRMIRNNYTEKRYSMLAKFINKETQGL